MKQSRIITTSRYPLVPLLWLFFLVCPVFAAPKATLAPHRDYCRVVCEQPNLSGSQYERFKPVRCTPCAE